MKCAMEESNPDEYPALVWMANYAAVLLNLCEVGEDGRTAYGRSKGKKTKLSGIEFGWKVRFGMHAAVVASSRVRLVSAEMIVGSAAGVWRARTVQRRSEAERWELEAADVMKGVSWKTSWSFVD